MNLKSNELNLIVSDIEFRSERRDKYLPLYEDLGYLMKLENSRNQVIFGRRGSGKTHLLGSFVESVNKKNKDIAVYIDIKKLTNDIIGNYDSETKSFLYFWAIAEEILIQSRQEITRRLSSKVNKKNNILRESIPLIDETLKSIALSKLNNKVGELNNNISSNALIGFIASSNREQIRDSSIKSGLELIINKVGIKYLIITIDEWSSLGADIQPRLANMLNKEFFTSKIITFKIATIKIRTQLYIVKNRIGLELGADIFGDIDLDMSQMWERGLDISKRFFIGMLLKHLNFSVDTLKLKSKKFAEKDILKMFASDKTFVELVKASEGIPRDFLNIFRRSYNYFFSDPNAKTIFIQHIKKAVADWYQDDKISALNPTSKTYQLLERLINEVIIKYKTKQFILPSDESSDREIQQLLDLRLLHLLKQGWSSKSTPGKRFDVFSIDYGAFISILATKIGKKLQQVWAGDEPLPEVNLRDIRRKEFSARENITKKTLKQVKDKLNTNQLILPIFEL